MLLYMVTFAINIPQMLADIPYMDPMGMVYGRYNMIYLTIVNGVHKPTYNWGGTILYSSPVQ